MLVTLQEIADRLEKLKDVVGDYKDGRDRTLRIFAEDTAKELLADVRDTIALRAEIAPADAKALDDLLADPALQTKAREAIAAKQPPSPEPMTPPRKKLRPHGGSRPNPGSPRA